MNRKSSIGEALELDAGRNVQIDMPEYCLQIAESAHGGQYRDTGEPYINHPIELEELMAYIIQPSEYTGVFLPSAYSHDVPEQKIRIP
jgi:(p)ppGpp synthase/HD superfamily hydrolase